MRPPAAFRTFGWSEKKRGAIIATEQESGIVQGEAVLGEAADAYREALGPRLVAAYALGSLAHGGFSPLVSDIDLGLVLADPLGPSDPETVQAVADAVKARATSVLHQRLSVFWGTPSTLRGRVAGGRFPPLDRMDLLDNGRLLHGEEARSGLPRPHRAELLVAGAEFALDFLGPGRGPASPAQGLGSLSPAGEEAVEEIRRPERLVARGPRHLTKIVLFPVRFLYTATTGRVGTNQAAADHYLASDEAPGARLVAAALTWRTTPPDDTQAAAGLLERELVPLYLHYIDDHIARLGALGEIDLVEAFEAWRGRLLG